MSLEPEIGSLGGSGKVVGYQTVVWALVVVADQ